MKFPSSANTPDFNMILKTTLVGLLFMAAVGWQAHVWADSVGISVDVDKPGLQISPRLYGIFFEDINRSGIQKR